MTPVAALALIEALGRDGLETPQGLALIARSALATDSHNRSVTDDARTPDRCHISVHAVERPHAVRGKGTSARAPSARPTR